MLENKYQQIAISEHISLYDKIIPKDHFLRKLKEIQSSVDEDAKQGYKSENNDFFGYKIM